jgi:single-stranded-DNA-specific exonuclease
MTQNPIWMRQAPPEADLIRAYATELNLHPSVVTVAMQRGHRERETLERFLYPRLKDMGDPFSLPDMKAAVTRLFAAIDRQERVVLYGDYDVDGVSSIALLHSVLVHYGLKPRCFLPTRQDEGYGLSLKGIDHGLDGQSTDLLIAADCGTNSRAEAELLKERGIDLIILDHHEPSPDGVADCTALVNPKLGTEHHYLCTAGVVFKVAHALLKIRPLAGFDLKNYLDLVAMATIADIVPLVGENRIFARRGLTQLDHTIHPGLAALKKVAKVSSPPQSHDVGFRLGPRLNASGRLDTAQTSLDLLLCQDPNIAGELAEFLDVQNRERQELEQTTRDQAEAMVEAMPPADRSHAIVVASADWHQGVVGIVASRISKRHHRPTFVLAIGENGVAKGSGRSVGGVSLVVALDSVRPLILTGGGHEMAAGVTLEADKIDEFRAAMLRSVAAQADDDTLTPKIHLDAEVDFPDLTLELLDSYELLQPFGAANPQPVFMTSRVSLVEPPRVVKEKHLRFLWEQNGTRHGAIYFNASLRDLPSSSLWDVAYTIDRNDFRGQSSLNIVVQAVRASG